MKTYLIALMIFLSLPVLAKSESPMGLFQIDSSNSIVTLAGRDKNVSGFIDIKQSFPDSKLKIESGESSFESTEISGTLEDFEVKGYLYDSGETREVRLYGKYFGTIDKQNGIKKVALKITSPECVIRVFAQRPTESTTALHKEVQEIIQ